MEPIDEPIARILVISGDSAALDEAHALLHRAGYTVRGAATGAEGLRLVRDYHPGLVLIDANLPDISGLDATRAIKADAELVTVPVINVSDQRASPDHLAASMAAGADGYLVGPLPGENMLARVNGFVLRKKMGDALRASEARLATMVHHTPDGILIVGREGQFRFVNPTAERMFGRRASELVGKPFEHPLETDQVAEIRVTDSERHTRTIELRVRKTTWEGQPGWLVFLRDVTERKRAEEEVQACLRQQAVVAELGQAALKGEGLGHFRDSAVKVVAGVFGAEYCYLLEYLPDDSALKLVAGVGWPERLVGRATLAVERDSQAGYTLFSGEPVITDNLHTETRFSLPSLLYDYGAVSGITVLVPGEHGPWGVLGVYATEPRAFAQGDVGFLQGVANVVAQAVQRAQGDEAIRRSAILLEAAGRTARLGGWVIDLARNRISLSDEACAIRELPVGASPTLQEAVDSLAPEWRKRFREVFDACARDGTPFDEELELITAGGHRIWVRSIGEAVRDDRGAITQVRGACQDITDKKRTEEELRRLAARLTNTLESITDAFFTLDHAWRFTYINKEAERLLQRKRAELLGKVVWEEFPGAVNTDLYHEYTHAMREHRAVHFETFYTPRGIWVEIHAYPSEEGLAVYFRDISERKQAEEHIQFLALYDPLTRLPNRRLLLDRLHQAMAACARSPEKGAVLFLDLDNFKILNDTLGHDQGDRLLQQLASRLTDAMREGDTVGRFGGDEFVIILERLSEQTDEAAVQAEAVGEKILSLLEQPYRLAGREHYCTATIGITLFGEHRRHDTVDDVIKRADLAMYRAKAEGRNALRLFDPGLQATVDARVELEAEMREGLQRKEFLPFYQPQVDAEGRVTGAEALARWQHPRRGLVLPAEFIPMAEETGLVMPLGRIMLQTVCVQLATWSRRPETAQLKLTMNVSARQFHHPDFVGQVLDVVKQTGANPQRLMLELTESVFLEDIEDTVTKMTALRARGVCFSLDGFGTGYSPLQYLKCLPLSGLKIDQRFVRDTLTDPRGAAIVRTMLVLAQGLGLAAIAEGVETKEVRDYLHHHGCSACQGNIISPPLPIDELEVFVRAR